MDRRHVVMASLDAAHRFAVSPSLGNVKKTYTGHNFHFRNVQAQSTLSVSVLFFTARWIL